MRNLSCRWALALFVMLPAIPVGAEERDPTQPPARAQAQASQPAADKSSTPEIDSAAIVVRDGKPFLVVGTRLYSKGEKLGPFIIERVGETEVWLRNGKELRKIQRFTGIERRTSTERSTP